MSLDNIMEDQYIKVRDLQRITLKPEDVLLIKVGIDGLSREQIDQSLSMIAQTFRENFPSTRIMITTVTKDRPFDVFAINKAFLVEEDEPSENDTDQESFTAPAGLADEGSSTRGQEEA